MIMVLRLKWKLKASDVYLSYIIYDKMPKIVRSDSFFYYLFQYPVVICESRIMMSRQIVIVVIRILFSYKNRSY